MKTDQFPPVPRLLLEALEATFKDTIPDGVEVSEGVFRRLQGQQSVVRFLRHKYEQQTKNILEN